MWQIHVSFSLCGRKVIGLNRLTPLSHLATFTFPAFPATDNGNLLAKSERTLPMPTPPTTVLSPKSSHSTVLSLLKVDRYTKYHFCIANYHLLLFSRRMIPKRIIATLMSSMRIFFLERRRLVWTFNLTNCVAMPKIFGSIEFQFFLDQVRFRLRQGKHSIEEETFNLE